jgi:hypothetical protein
LDLLEEVELEEVVAAAVECPGCVAGFCGIALGGGLSMTVLGLAGSVPSCEGTAAAAASSNWRLYDGDALVCVVCLGW